MSFKNVLKSNVFLCRMGRAINIHREFIHDSKNFAKYYNNSAEKKNDYRYSIMLIVHSIEKGLCMEKLRPFGSKKIIRLINILKTYPQERHNEFEYSLAVAVLNAWKKLYDTKNWVKENGYSEAVDFLKTQTEPEISAGFKEYIPISANSNFNDFERVLLSRHSVRDFQDKPLEATDIDFALDLFIEAPTACNRQMCKIYYITKESIKKTLDDVIIGVSGFNKNTVNYFIVTYDLAAFAYSGERQQGLLNAGLCAMNFVNGLHIKGIGSCFMQWTNKPKEDETVRRMLGLADSERIAVVIGAGYYLDKNIIPCSTRKPKEEIFKTI